MRSIFIATAMLLFSVTAYGQEGLLNKLLAPGALIEGHKDLEHKDCLDCHTAAAGVPNDNCLLCHKEIQKSMEGGTSFHGRHKKECYTCHADHKGRTYDSTKIDEDKFDHKLTGFGLRGKHQEIDCKKCHTETRAKKFVNKSGTRWFGITKKTCIDCHKEDDVHFFKGDFANRDCGKCHNEISWREEIKFDHQRDAEYALVGGHKKLKCEKCHVPNGPSSAKYEWPNFSERKCLSCHKDVHANNLSQKFQGGNCEKCHGQEKWEITNFPHEITGFILKGRHARAECTACHKQTGSRKEPKNYNWRGLKSQCVACHKDYHGFALQQSARFGALENCARCHNFEDFKKSVDFNHNHDTRFDLDGKHLKNKCFDCHKPSPAQAKGAVKSRTYKWLQLETKTCETCHKSPHTKTFPPKLLAKKCTECHVTEGWNIARKGKGKGFDHDATRFPLTGKHLTVKCNTCHIKGRKEVYKFPNADQEFCVNCHKKVHARQFDEKFQAKSCAECHTTTNFRKLKEFDHNKTEFPLTGKHAQIASRCSKCHTPTKQILASKPPRPAGRFLFGADPERFCSECHGDVHEKQFSREFSQKKCITCHSTENFTRRLKFDHNSTSFALRDSHTKVKCESCHVPTKEFMIGNPPHRGGKYKFPEIDRKNCATCHKDAHNGDFGTRCSSCHNEREWSATREFHKNFTLAGVHYSLQCEECHIDNRRLGGLSEECLLCHQKDDVHRQTLPNCNECHRQTFWENPNFNHSMTAFPLRGAHRAEDCAKCHGDGRYMGRPSACVDCHASDRASVTSQDHSPAAFERCEQCHNQFSFQGATVR